MKRMELHTIRDSTPITYVLRIYTKSKATIEYPDNTGIYRKKSIIIPDTVKTLERFFRGNCFIIDSKTTLDKYISSIK